MIKGKDILAITTISALSTTPISAISPYSVIETTEQEKINKLKENIYIMFNTKYTKNSAMLNNPSNNGQTAYKIQIASNLEELQTSKQLKSYSEFEKEFNKLYSNLNYKEKIIVRYTTTSRIIENNEVVDYKEQKYTGNEEYVIWSTLDDGSKIGKIPLSPDTETKEPRFIKVKIGDTKLDTTKPIFRTKNGYYIDENGYSIKKVNLNEIETKESLPHGVIDGYYEDTSVPLTEEDKIEVTDAIVKRADELKTTTYNVSELYESNIGRLTTLGNELFKYIEEKNSLNDYTVIFEGVDKYTDNKKEIYIDKNDNNNSVVKYVENNKLVDSNDLSKINIIIEEKTKDNKYLVEEIVIKPVRNNGLENILDIISNNMKTYVFAGTDRYKTSVEVSKNGFKNGSENLVLVCGENEALIDGLTATPLAATLNAPILLTSKATIPECVIEEIDRLGVKNIYIVGGENSVSLDVSDKLEKYYGKNVIRIEGEDRYETSIKVSEEVVRSAKGKVDTFIVGGTGLADALSVSPVAGSKKSPIILTNKEGLSDDGKHFLNKYAEDTYMIGGNSHISTNVSRDIVNLGLTTKRLSGSSRQDTNAAIIKEFYGVGKELYNDRCMVVAKSNDASLVDALSAGAFASKVNAPIVLAGDKLSEDQEDVLISMNKKKSLVQVGYGIYNGVLDFILNR